jgi:hypothetical protein
MGFPGMYDRHALGLFRQVRTICATWAPRWRSDILLHNMPPSLISTPDDFYDRTSALKDKLLNSQRKLGVDSSDYEETLATVLGQLYELVGKPVIVRTRRQPPRPAPR